MGKFQWRQRARMVYYADVFMCGMTLAGIIILAIYASTWTWAGMTGLTESPNELENLKQAEKEHITSNFDRSTVATAWTFWGYVALNSLVMGLQLWAAIKLMNSTELERSDIGGAWENARTWRNVNITILIFTVIIGFFVGPVLIQSFLGIAIILPIRGLFIYWVSKFMGEMKARLTPDPTLTTVTWTIITH